jgi:hypothetical protein
LPSACLLLHHTVWFAVALLGCGSYVDFYGVHFAVLFFGFIFMRNRYAYRRLWFLSSAVHCSTMLPSSCRHYAQFYLLVWTRRAAKRTTETPAAAQRLLHTRLQRTEGRRLPPHFYPAHAHAFAPHTYCRRRA